MVEKLSKGFKEFLIKSFIFVVLFIVIQLITMGVVAKTTLPGELKLFAMDDLAEALLFMVIIFIGLSRKKILEIKSYSVGAKTRVLSFVLIVVGFFVYFSYKNFLIENITLVGRYIYFFTLIEYLLLFAILFLLANLVFGFRFICNFFREHKKGLLFVLVGTVIVYNLIREFQGLWPYFSGFVSHSASYLLGFFGSSSVHYSGNLPILVFNGFSAGIAKTCSGIDSVLLFTGLYLGLVAWDFSVLNKKKIVIMFIPGLIGAFLLNIVRIFLLFLLGAYISRDFALNAFHTNASSFLFIIYFAIFWGVFYKWMRK